MDGMAANHVHEYALGAASSRNENKFGTIDEINGAFIRDFLFILSDNGSYRSHTLCSRVAF